MIIKWEALMQNEKRQFENMGELEKFIYFLLFQYGSPYGWGKENPEASDCSGAVCLALYAATGLLIRTTADDLYRRVFTKVNPRSTDIRAVFYLTKGTATHIAGMVDDGVILNSQEPCAKVRRVSDVSDYFQKRGYEVAVRGLNREALAKLAGEGKAKYELDPELSKYFEVTL
jgi:murein DD-endopeptidase